MDHEMHVNIANRTLDLAHRIAATNKIDADFSTDAPLRDVGLSSVDLVSLMLAIEAEFDIMIPAPCLNADNFRSIETIARMVETVSASVKQ